MKTRFIIRLILGGLVLGVIAASAHHSVTAQYDEKKTLTLKGTLVKFDWTNPHVLVLLDVDNATWEVEFPRGRQASQRCACAVR